jgi:hypothetical protein
LYQDQELKEKNQSKRDAIQSKRKLNDQAYFLFLFSRLEDIIRERSAKLIANKQKLKHWKDRRSWQTFPTAKNDTRFDLMRRTELLFERGKTEFNLIKKWKDERDEIAHGGIMMKPLVIIQEANKMEDIVRLIKKQKV